MKDLLTRINNAATQKFGAEYAEARAQDLAKTMLTMKEGRTEVVKQGIENGVALRVLINGAWGFASVGSLEEDVLTRATSDACRMAKAAGLSVSRLAHVFKAQTGMSVTAYVNMVRVKRAEYYLANSQLRVSETAFQVGFGNLSHFNHVFRQATGLSPTQYRRQHTSTGK